VWAKLEREFRGDEQRARREAALATRGLAIAAPDNRPDLARLEGRSGQGLLPIPEHLLRAPALLSRAGFSAQGVAERLEYRAQLTALCEAPDPRLAWVDVLAAGEGETQSVTAHAAADRQLLVDLIGRP